MDDQQESKRAFYRIRYPEAARPGLWVGLKWFAVTELSEHGMRILADESLWTENQTVAGKLRLYAAGTREVRGRVGRSEPPEVVIAELRGIPFADVLAEQRALIRDYPSQAGGPP